MGPRGRATQQSQDTSKSNQANQPALSSPEIRKKELINRGFHNSLIYNYMYLI